MSGPSPISATEPELLRLFPDTSVRGKLGRGDWRRGLADEISAIADAAKFAAPGARHFLRDLQSWCESMFAHTLFRRPEGWALLRVLCEWILSAAVPDHRRMERLRALLLELDDASEDWPAQLGRIRSWAESFVQAQAPFHQLVLEKLQQLEAAVALAKSPGKQIG